MAAKVHFDSAIKGLRIDFDVEFLGIRGKDTDLKLEGWRLAKYGSR